MNVNGQNNNKINGSLIMDALGDIDDALLREADAFRRGEGRKRKKSNISRFIALPIAAAAVLVLGVITVGRMGNLTTKDSASAMMNAADSASETASEAASEAASASTDDITEDSAWEEVDGCSDVDDVSYGTKDEDEASFAPAEEADEVNDIKEGTTYDAPFYAYTGYLDDVAEVYGLYDFLDADFDADGGNDRVYRQYLPESDTSIYTIEFADGNIAIIPESPSCGVPEINTQDIDGDGNDDYVFSIVIDADSNEKISYQIVKKGGKTEVFEITL